MRILTLGGILLLSGCSLLPDHSLDYQQAKDLSPLQLAEGQEARVIKPLYAIPDFDAATAQPQTVVIVGKGRGKHFVAPLPKPLVVAANANSSMPSSQPSVLKPQIISDGNGHPVMQIAGDILQVWDNLNKALTAANIKVSDRNQSLGLYFVELLQDGKKTAYQLKLTRTSNDNVISLQKDDDTIAESEVSQNALERVLKNWPAS